MISKEEKLSREKGVNGILTNEEFGRKVYEIHGLRFPR